MTRGKETFTERIIPRTGLICTKCGGTLRGGQKAVVRLFRSPVMRATGFYYLHKKCAPKGWGKKVQES